MIRQRGGLVLAAALAALLLPAGQAAASCVTPAERAAKMVRHLQTQLMVGALQCRGDREQRQRAIYNRFVTENGAALRRHAEALTAHFRRGHGPDHRQALDGHITGVANLISAESRTIEDFCGRIADLGESLFEGGGTLDLVSAAAMAPIPFPADEPLCPAGAVTAAVD